MHAPVSPTGSRTTAAEPDYATTLFVRDTCLCLHAQRAARALARRFDAALGPVGLTSGQFSLLMSLNRPEPPKMGTVATLLAMDRTTLTANLKPLERRGLVETSLDPGDRRARLLRLTPAGRRLLGRAVPIWRRVHGEIEARLPDPDLLRAELISLAHA
jgi:DNA-binding MarR family transcriptional regulator